MVNNITVYIKCLTVFEKVSFNPDYRGYINGDIQSYIYVFKQKCSSVYCDGNYSEGK